VWHVLSNLVRVQVLCTRTQAILLLSVLIASFIDILHNDFFAHFKTVHQFSNSTLFGARLQAELFRSVCVLCVHEQEDYNYGSVIPIHGSGTLTTQTKSRF